jgi:hypothetical protein
VDLPALPETVALYLTTLAESHKVSTLTRRISAISQAHQAAGFDPPTQAPVVRQLMKGIRRTLGTAQTGKSPVKVSTCAPSPPASIPVALSTFGTGR